MPDETIRVVNETDTKVTAHVTQNDKNVVHPALLEPKAVLEVNLGSDVYYASVIDGSCAGHVAFSAGQILTVTDSQQAGYDLTVNEVDRR